MGFGASMDIIYNFPTVADLLISMAAAAASNPNSQHRQRFFACPNPPSDFVSENLRHNNSNNPDDNMGIKWQELQQVCTALLHNCAMQLAFVLLPTDGDGPCTCRIAVLCTCSVC